jgi:hypothetical protein
MINFNEFSLQVLPGAVCIHQDGTETIELTVHQIKSFIEALTAASHEATRVGLEAEKMERAHRARKALMAATKFDE